MKYDYQTVYLSHLPGQAKKDIQKWTDRGWELISVTSHTPYDIGYFRRLIKD